MRMRRHGTSAFHQNKEEVISRNNSNTTATTTTTAIHSYDSIMSDSNERSAILLVSPAQEEEQEDDDDDNNSAIMISSSPYYNNNNTRNSTTTNSKQRKMYNIRRNFLIMSILFSANHGCVVACLSLATARLGSVVGAWQSGLLYATYSISGLTGSTYIVKELNSRNALICGMGLYCLYVAAFWIATIVPNWSSFVAALGAVGGGIGAGFLWTAQGSYFASAAHAYEHAKQQQAEQEYERQEAAGSGDGVDGNEQQQQLIHDVNADDEEGHQQNTNESTSSWSSSSDTSAEWAGHFAFIYLSLEIVLRALSTIVLRTTNLSWSFIFASYFFVALSSTIFMLAVEPLTAAADNNDASAPQQQQIIAATTNSSNNDSMTPQASVAPSSSSSSAWWYKMTAAWQLLRHDGKMKYLIFLNVVFGFASSFLTSFVNGQVVHRVLGSDENLGVLTAWVSCVAAVASLGFGRYASKIGKGTILSIGALCFLSVALPFLVWPGFDSGQVLVLVYTLHGIGRSTFEGTLRSTFADFFDEKEGAFANIILQNGLASALGFVLSFTLKCGTWKTSHLGPYCVEYRDGSVHDVLSFELLIVVTAVLAIAGYRQAAEIHKAQQQQGATSPLNDDGRYYEPVSLTSTDDDGGADP